MAKPQAHQRAVDLRRSGWTYADIVQELGVSKGSCSLWLRDLPADPPSAEAELSSAELQQLRAVLHLGAAQHPVPDEVVLRLRGVAAGDCPLPAELGTQRDTVRWLRACGWSLLEIHRRLGVPTSTASQWCRDVIELPGNVVSAAEQVRAATAERRDRRRVQDKQTAAELVGALSDRETVLAAAVAYWCEGSKDKPYDRREWLSFVNSDAGLVRLWMRFLDLMDVPMERRRLRILIHETGDLSGSTTFWSGVTGLPEGQFGKPTIKKHTPSTNRRNVGADYHGCLCVTVAGSARLYRVVEGVAKGVMQRCGTVAMDGGDGDVSEMED